MEPGQISCLLILSPVLFSWLLKVAFFLPKVPRSFCNGKGFQYHTTFSLSQTISSVPCHKGTLGLWIKTRGEGIISTHSEDTGNSQKAPPDGAPGTGLVPESPRSPEVSRSMFTRPPCSRMCHGSCTRPDAVPFGVDIWWCQGV